MSYCYGQVPLLERASPHSPSGRGREMHARRRPARAHDSGPSGRRGAAWALRTSLCLTPSMGLRSSSLAQASTADNANVNLQPKNTQRTLGKSPRKRVHGMLKQIGAIKLHQPSATRLTCTAAIVGAVSLGLPAAAVGRAQVGGSRTGAAASRPPSGAVMKIRPTRCLIVGAYEGKDWSTADCVYYYKNSAGNLVIVALRG